METASQEENTAPKTTTTAPPVATSQDVPIFLRKTYHMIETCDPEIACWAEDGDTFVVKDPEKFERTIIPQFFKHSKFSSFVRQLNFYSFRKIKYADTIRIDPKLEAETANYWRFRHENFRRGHPELLSQIKRMHGQKSSSNGTTVNNSKEFDVTPSETPSSDAVKKPVEAIVVEKIDTNTKTEVLTLKKRIEEMTKNIDELTEMVKKVSMKQEEHECSSLDEAMVGVKRKKVAIAESDAMTNLNDIVRSIPMDLEEDLPMPLMAMPSPQYATRETSAASASTDSEFVEQLFSTFGDDEGMFLEGHLSPFDFEQQTLQGSPEENDQNDNRPDPELMKRLSDALMLLPRDIQVMIVDRLIAAITSSDSPFFGYAVSAAATTESDKYTLKVTDEVKPMKIESSSDSSREAADVPRPLEESRDDSGIDAPLAAATLAALLRHFSSQSQGKSHKNVQKTIPVIPVHA